jgi:hypothetical protein
MIEWNTVTWYSKALAVAVFVGTLALGGYLGMQYQQVADFAMLPGPTLSTPVSMPSAQASSTPLITLKAPVEGAVLCRGSNLEVDWQASSTVDEVLINVADTLPASPFGQFPATWNESGTKGMGVLHWTVGTYELSNNTFDYPDGNDYRIHIDAMRNGQVVGSADSGLFTIQTCQG